MSVYNILKLAGEENLVLNADFLNPKSYAGPAIRNYTSNITQNPGTSTGYSFVAGSENLYIPGLYSTLNCKFVDAYNDYPAVSSNCCPNLFLYAIPVTGISPNSLYTYSIVYKTKTGYTHPNYLYRYEFNGGTVVTEAGTHSTTNRMHLGDDWYWAWSTFTTTSNIDRLFLYSFYYKYQKYTDRLWVAKVALFSGSYANMHPTLWPDSGVTRATSSALFDLSGQNNFDVNNLKYDSSGNPFFNGTDSYVIARENSALNTQTVSVEVWTKTASTNQNGFWFEKGQVNTQYSLFQEGTTIVWRQKLSGTVTNITVTAATYINTTSWAHIVGTYTSGERRLYINGALVASDSATGTFTADTNGTSIGVYGGHNGGRGYYYTGSIGIVRVYNKSLSAGEVRNNYDAMRSRFGL